MQDAGISGLAVDWTQQLLIKLERGVHNEHMDSKAKADLIAECTVIVTIFTEKFDDWTRKDVMKALWAHRDKLCFEAVQWLTEKRNTLIWEKKHGLTFYEK
ncbi:unnamed protein product [Calypogeia fissa]